MSILIDYINLTYDHIKNIYDEVCNSDSSLAPINTYEKLVYYRTQLNYIESFRDLLTFQPDLTEKTLKLIRDIQTQLNDSLSSKLPPDPKLKEIYIKAYNKASKSIIEDLNTIVTLNKKDLIWT